MEPLPDLGNADWLGHANLINAKTHYINEGATTKTHSDGIDADYGCRNLDQPTEAA